METKELKQQLDSIETELKGFIAKASEEEKLTGKALKETVAEIERLSKSATETTARLLGIEQKLTAPRGDDVRLVKSIGEMFTESEQYKSMISSGRNSCEPFAVKGLLHKTALVNATGQNQPLVPSFRLPGTVTPAEQPLTIRDVVPSMPISSNLLEWVRETSFTNNAAVQGDGSSPQVFENVSKAESALAFALASTPVRTVAHWIPVSNQLLADAPALQAYVNVRLMYGLKLKEEGQFVNGDGNGANLSGLLDSGNFTAYDTSDDAIKQARVNSFYRADTIILNPADWERIELSKTTGTSSSGQYLVGNPAGLLAPRLWGRNVVECDSVAEHTFIVGAMAQAAMILDREGATISVSREHASFFIQNMTAILAEERVVFLVTRPAAIISGTFAQDDGDTVID
jgi:HK97 family phage major capsid protein